VFWKHEKFRFFSKWCLYVANAFQRDQCLLRASALAYVTSLSIVPFLAVAFSISKGFGFQNSPYIHNFLMNITAGREKVVEHIIDYINRTDVGTLGAVGVAILLVTVFSLIGTIENTLNTIWGAKYQRPLRRKFADYLSVTLVCPLLIIVALSFTASMQSHFLVQEILSYTVFSYVYLAVLKLMPFLLVAMALFFLYKFVPNTRIGTKSALGAAAVAGVLWQVSQSVFINYQIGVSRYNAIYGSFAQLPFFLVWLYLSWVIVLVGAEVGFGLENYERESAESTLGQFNIGSKERLSLAIMLVCVRRFEAGEGAVAARELVRILNLPLKAVNQILYVLVRTGFLLPVQQGDQEEGYTLAGSPRGCTLGTFLEKVREYREPEDVSGFDDPEGYVQGLLREIYRCGESRSLQRNLVELAYQAPDSIETVNKQAGGNA
jgi:membrane protein